MNQKHFRLIIVFGMLVFLLFLPSHALGATCTWDGSSGNNWSSSAHWTGCGTGVPGASDTAVISSGSVTLDSAVTIQNLTLSGGTITGSNDITITGAFQWDSGTLGGTGNANANGTMSLTGSGSRTLQDSRTLNNAGTLTWNTTGWIYTYSNAVFTNKSGANMNLQGASTYLFYGSAGTVNNAGTINKSGSGDTEIYSGAFNNSGTFKLTGTGTVSVYVYNASEQSGPFQVGNNNTLTFSGGTFDLNAGSDVSGAGAVNFAGTTLNVHSIYNITGTTTVSGATVHFFSDATLTSLGGLDISSGTLDLNSGETPSVNTFTMSGGTLTGSDNLGASTFTWNSGTLGGFGTLTVNTSMSLTGSGSRTLQDSRTLNNAGTLTWNTTSWIYTYSNAVFNNQSGANMNVQGAGTYLFYGSAGTINNAGTINKSGSGDTEIYSGAFNNSGTFKLTGTGTVSVYVYNASEQSGPFQVGNNNTLTFSGGTFDLNAGSDVSGAGTVDFAGTTLNVYSTYNITGTTTVSGATVHFFSDATLTTLGGLDISSGTLDLNSGETPSVNTFTMNGGTLTGSDNMGASTFTWNSGTLGGFGTLTVNTIMSLTGSGSRTLQDNRTLTNAGTLTWNTTGWINTYNNSVFNNQSGANMNIQSAGTYLFYGSAGTVNNAGTINKSGSGDTEIYSGAFNNSGTFKLTGTGTVNVYVYNASEQSGPFQVGNNDTLTFSGGTFDLNAGADVSGAGAVNFAGGTLNVHSTYNITGTTTVSGATVHFFSDATLTSLGGLDISSGTLDLNSGETLNVNNFTMSGGTLTGSDSMNVNNFNWTGGTLGGTGTTTVNGPISITGSNSRVLQDSRVFNNTSTLTWNSTSYLIMYNTPVFNNQAGATINTVNSGSYLFYGSTGTLNNAGTLNLRGEYVYVGHFIQSAGATTSFELDGTTVGTQYPQIYATDVNLNGSAVVTLGNGFVPAFGNTFNLINTTTRTGNFSNVALPGLDPGYVWNSAYSSNGWNLKVFYGIYIPFVIK